VAEIDNAAADDAGSAAQSRHARASNLA